MPNISLAAREMKLKAITLILLFYILPPSAIALGLIPYEYRFPLLIGITPIMLLIRPTKHTTITDLGITSCKLRQSILSIIPLTVILTLPLLITFFVTTTPRIDNSSLPLIFYIFYALISCPFQEFAYRGYLFCLMAMLNLGKWSTIFIAAILYSYVHIIYLDIPTLLFTLLAGFLWNIHYDKFRNIASVTLSHIVLGTATILLGLI